MLSPLLTLVWHLFLSTIKYFPADEQPISNNSYLRSYIGGFTALKYYDEKNFREMFGKIIPWSTIVDSSYNLCLPVLLYVTKASQWARKMFERYFAKHFNKKISSWQFAALTPVFVREMLNLFSSSRTYELLSFFIWVYRLVKYQISPVSEIRSDVSHSI